MRSQLLSLFALTFLVGCTTTPMLSDDDIAESVEFYEVEQVDAADVPDEAVALISTTFGTRLVVRIPTDADVFTVGAVLIEDGSEPVGTTCRMSAEGTDQFTVSSCADAEHLSPITLTLPEQSEFTPVSIEELTNIAMGYADRKIASPAGDQCRAHCHYQWQLAIVACALLNPTPGCYDQANLYVLACYAACPL